MTQQFTKADIEVVVELLENSASIGVSSYVDEWGRRRKPAKEAISVISYLMEENERLENNALNDALEIKRLREIVITHDEKARQALGDNNG